MLKAMKSLGEKLEEVGTPADMPKDAREGFEISIRALDDLSVRPLGIYGSKSEIVRYIKDLDLINDEM